jgi:superfamily II DNA/RNA helicase
MAPMAEKIAKFAPELKLRQAHGKMPAAEIDEEMIRFASGDGDILLATNIIEAGLDIPRANTMIIWRSDRFGLAQLHQLRGRIGRGRARGYLFLVTEAEAQIAPATLKRLRTMEALDQLGAGFAISARDLDLRGAELALPGGSRKAGSRRRKYGSIFTRGSPGSPRERSSMRWRRSLKTGSGRCPKRRQCCLNSPASGSLRGSRRLRASMRDRRRSR